jgi:hypothetical protein
LAWIEGQALVSTPTETATVRNATASRRARLALDSAEDVVLIDVDVECVDLSAAEPGLVGTYIERVGWDPRQEPGAWTLLVMTPRRIQAWDGPAEIDGRTVMAGGQWRTD